MLTPSVTSAGEPLTFAIHPYLPTIEVVERFMPLVNYLSRETGYPIEIHVSKTYQEHIQNVGRDEFDLAYVGPAPYVTMVRQYGRKPLLSRLEVNGSPTFRKPLLSRLEVNGSPTFHGYIIVRKDSSIRTIANLAGKNFAFVDPNSTMGHKVPRYMMWKEGVDVKNLSGYTFMGTHPNVALGVLAGDFDAGAVKEEVFHEYEKRGLRGMKMTPALSEHIFVTSTKMPVAEVEALRKAMYKLKESETGRNAITAIKSSATGLVPVQDTDYDNLRDIMDTLKKIGVK
jgi:phosphonate transport system substrate-binding protein